MSRSAFFALSFVIFGFTPLVFGQKKSWIIFQKDNYQISYPETWNLDTSHISSTDFVLTSPQTSTEDLFRENLNLIVQDLKGLNFDLDNFTALSEQQIQNYMQESELIENERMKKAGLDCHHLVYTAKKSDRTLRFEQYYWIINDKAYVLSFTAELEAFEAFKDTSKHILDSFVVK